MKIHFIFIVIIYCLLLTSCLIERPADWWFLEPNSYKDTTSFHGETINSTVYNDEENNFSIILNCIESNVDTFHYELLYTLINTSKENIIFRLPQIELFTKDYWLIADLSYDVLIESNNSVQHRIKFIFLEKNKSFEKMLTENESNIIVTNLFVEIGTKEIGIPDFYFK